MRYRWLILGSFFILFIICHPHTPYAKMAHVKMSKDVKMMKEEGPVNIEADNLIYEKDAQLYQAHGNVNVVRGDFSLKADHAQLNKETKDLVAWGNVSVIEGEDVLECERLEVNLDTQLGKIYQAKLFLKDQNFHIIGREVEKLGENRYLLRDGSFTTCDARPPPWKFTMKELDVTLQGSGTAKGPVFYLEDIPVLYFPVAYFPLRTERQTGFLMPWGAYSREFGPEMRNAFFWAISKDMDATFYLDASEKRGFKEGLEYRYAFTKETKGQANFYFTHDQDINKNRYAFFLQHEEKFPYDFYLKANINHVSDNNYPRDFVHDLPWGARIDSTSLGQLRSDLFGGKNWDQFSFLAQGVVFQDLTKESNAQTVQKLPQISFYAHPQSLFKTPFFYDASSTYTNFWREQGLDAHRGDFFPRISYPTRLFDVLKLESNVGLRETFYQAYNDPTHQFQGWKSRETLETDMAMSTEFYRVYDGASISKISNLFKVAKWMHTIEPTISYSYSPRVRQSDLPFFDDVDRIPYTSQFTYGINQRLVGKPQKEGITSGPYEYGRLKVFQSYSLGNPLQTDSNGNPIKGRYFSDIQAELWWNFNPYLSGQLETGFNPYEGRFDEFNALLTAKDRRNDAIQVQYRNTRGSIDEINLYTRVKTIAPLYLYGGMRYNIFGRWMVDNMVGAEYQAQCWILGLSIDNKYQSPDGTQTRELRYELYFNLLGIGSVGHKSYFMTL
jgi:LPS-assembly protein